MNDMTQGYIEWDNMMAMLLVIVAAGASLLQTYVLIHGTIRRKHGQAVQFFRTCAWLVSGVVACSVLAFIGFVVLHGIHCRAEIADMGSTSADTMLDLLMSPLTSFAHVIVLSLIPIGIGAVARKTFASTTHDKKQPNQASEATSVPAQVAGSSSHQG